jgi:hypothetical protein
VLSRPATPKTAPPESAHHPNSTIARSGPLPTFADGTANGSKDPILTDAAACTYWHYGRGSGRSLRSAQVTAVPDKVCVRCGCAKVGFRRLFSKRSYGMFPQPFFAQIIPSPHCCTRRFLTL